MARRITRHATRLSQVHEAALDTPFSQGQRVQTIDGLPGRILFVTSSFSPGITEYEVQLDSGMGQGTYTASQLRPIPADYRAGHPGSNLPAGVTAGLEAEAAEVHIASEDYPEMGDILLQRPDPGGHIAIIGGLRRTAADSYGRPDDARDNEYDGGEAATGMHWAEPAQQEWVENNLGPQEEAPPPTYDAGTFAGNVMARLQMLEEADQLFGLQHHATSINGTQIDGHGDAPEHGTTPRADEPNAYDEQSTEGDGDPKWSEPMPDVSKKNTNGAMVGMYPEGISAGDGPGIPTGAVVAELRLVNPDDPDKYRPVPGYKPHDVDPLDTLPAHVHDHIRNVHQVGDDQAREEMQHGELGGYGYHDALHTADEIYGADWRQGAPPHSIDDLRAQASRVPWTGQERGELHKFDTGTSATVGDFVPSTEFTNRYPVSEQIEDPAPGLIEQELAEQSMQHTAASEDDWAGHMRQQHGYGDSDIARFTGNGDRPSDLHAAIHDAGLADHEHDETTYDQMTPEAPSGPEEGGATSGDPSRALTDSQPASVYDPASWSDLTRQHRLSALAAAEEHDGPSFDEPGGPDEWPMAQANVTSGGTAFTQGQYDGKKPWGGSKPPMFPPAMQPAQPGMTTPQDHLAAFVAATSSPAFRFEFTASWRDVVAKAKRIRAAGRVRLTMVTAGLVVGEVSGEHDIYESGIQRPPGKPSSIQHWACGCPWASFHQDKSFGTRYAGRPCSHVMALQFEAQAQSMFGGSPEAGPSAEQMGIPHQVVVKSLPPWDQGHWRQHWLAPAASLHKTAEMFCPACGDDRDDSGRCYNCGTVSRDLRQEDPLPGAINVSPEEEGEEAAEREQDEACGCFYKHDGPCPSPDEDLNRTAESIRHSRPREFYSEITRNPRHNPASYSPRETATHLLTGYIGPKKAGEIHFSQSDDGQAAEVHMLHTYSKVDHTGQRINGEHKGVGSAMMDDLYGHVKQSGGWLDHGVRTGAGNSWWASYREPHPEINTHHAHPDAGWKDYWSPDRVAMDAGENFAASKGRGAHTKPTWRVRDYPHDDHEEKWTQARGLQEPSQQATAALLAAGEDLGELIALAQLAGLTVQADQANAPWGSDNVSAHPPQKPYGATAPPNKDQDPGSYGPLSAPDPENWGGIEEDNAIQMPMSNSASLGEPVDQDDQGTFGYSDQANAAGPATAMNPADPQGLSMDAELRSDPDGTLFVGGGEDGESVRRHLGIDGTPGDAQDVPHQFADGGMRSCEACGLDFGADVHHRTAELHDEPEAALPSTTGEEEPQASLTGPDAETERGRRMAAAGGMGDQGIAEGLSGGAQEPSPVTQEPGMGSMDDSALAPENPSIQTMGNQQWSGGGADSGEGSVEPGDASGSIDDIVAAFQRSAAAKQLGGAPAGSGGAVADGDIAAAARQFLSKTADVLPEHEAAALINEGRGERARNLGLLQLEGTHYEDQDEDLHRRGLSLDDYDDDVVSA